ncbi:exodeoxyribonuclease VII small subunit [Phocicoccus pinnipedialis]|uniref:Exodeoxyribonuclease 7 small subunit n=1 Tax=Phocicoccus pinnipedialis TaxID=110845 RepID=A0A6V7RFB2_9BACL|nr:exodeoxyribonuclease VII small subunit [Jeotgalicoccus pinnipedialis]MBP1939322.1 exodeoxyribonuclease VII small subunit [Jeotgalicoccus pinnipedialis]CAD2075882.1 Exodeoxyribonuclease 7 small subunit [Jeotgalicoccus pinnipedialis]
MTNKYKSFEDKLKRIDEIVLKLDSDEITLEESLELYKEGVILTKECDDILKNAQLNIEELTKDDSDGE